MNSNWTFLSSRVDHYIEENRTVLVWLLDRLERGRTGAFVDTKFDAIERRDYADADGLRGPGITYGWIQGRALEALVTHAAFFEHVDPHLAEQLDAAAIGLYDALESLVPTNGQAAFCYDKGGAPVAAASYREGGARTQSREQFQRNGRKDSRKDSRENGPENSTESGPDNGPDSGCERGRNQAQGQEIRTYSDVFIVKGRIAAAARYRPTALASHLAVLDDIVAAIEQDRFLRDESRDIDARALAAEDEDYGPRMILLGAAALLHRSDCAAHDTFSARFVEHVLMHHLDTRSGLLAGAPGGSSCNVGHAIEFAGFAFEARRQHMTSALADTLADLVERHFDAGFKTPGIRLEVAIPSGQPTSKFRPWWCLPETIRAAAFAHAATGRSSMLDIWRRADAAFFTHYRLPDDTVPVAYQTLDDQGPVDHVPATPDLDPAYHTGLSLLGAIESVRLSGGQAGDQADGPASDQRGRQTGAPAAHADHLA